jgi:fructoselysine-6-P-deglycase FrlB-like protein
MLEEVARAERAAKFEEEQLAELQKELNEAPRVEDRVGLTGIGSVFARA